MGVFVGRSIKPASGWKIFASACLAFVAQTGSAAPGLTDAENRWIEAVKPVVAYAKRQQLPIDIVVQPQDAPGLPPLAMAYVDQRCKLVLSMRGNASVATVLAGVPESLQDVAVETMAAHELGHCWRYVHGAWRTLPAGFVPAEQPPTDDMELARMMEDMRDIRREEGFADLVGLAWTARQHPKEYTEIHAWISRLRDDFPMPGSHHDTRAWLRLAAEPDAFDNALKTPFLQAQQLWRAGLLNLD
jgi:hypothetical protein